MLLLTGSHIPENSCFGNVKGERSRLEFINSFSSYWNRNQSLFHKRLETGIELKRTNLILLSGHDKILESISKKGHLSLSKRINDLVLELDKYTIDAKNDINDLLKLEPMTGKSASFDYTPIFRSFRKAIGKATKNLPSEIEMMDTGSLTDLNDVQGKSVQTVSFSVDRIADYIIETSFISKVQQALETHNSEINLLIAEVINSLALLKYQIQKQDLPTEIINQEIIETIDAGRNKLEEQLINSQNSFDAFKAELNEILNRCVSQLDVKHILDQADVLTQYVRKQELQIDFKGKIRSYRSIFNRYGKNATSFISNRKEKLRQIEFEKQNQLLKNNADILRSYYDSILADPASEKYIPYYYKQLYSGKHLQSSKKPLNRKSELDKINHAIRQIENGVHGAIMISGASLSGKSFLSEFVANHVLSGNTFYISPPEGGSIELEDLNQALNQATSLPGTIEEIFQKAEAASVFIFNDIELWWLNSYKGNMVIEKLTSLVKKYGARHYFLFNSNIHALNYLIRSSSIQEVLTTTVLLKPMSNEEIRHEILKRHKIGGIALKYKGDFLNPERLDRHSEKLFNRIYRISKGNIGHALQLWLLSISMTEDGDYIMNLPSLIDFPEINENKWNNLLLQLLIHNSLSLNRFSKLYKSKGESWTNNVQREINIAMITEKPGGLSFKLKKILRK